MAFSTWMVFTFFICSENGAGLVLNTNCVAPSPCTCTTYDIDCAYNELRKVPAFPRHNEYEPYVNLQLDHNRLTVIPAYAFKNVSAVDVLDLSNNHIHSIELHAFGGIETTLSDLDLTNNNLRHLPLALGELPSLSSLRLVNNPLMNLDATVMANISTHLRTLTLSADHFSSFPEELKYLSGLLTLTINDIRVPIVHSTVFHSFADSLCFLEMSYATFESIPVAFCRLKSLRSFTSSYSQNLGKYNSSIFDECTHPMTSVISLTLENDQLTIFPKLSFLFPNLHTLILNYNAFRFIDSNALSGLSSLTALYILGNSFTGIPSAINKAVRLEYLDVSFNQIDTVEDFDFQCLHNLTHILLRSNPLIYMSPYAFAHNPLLTDINMDGTILVHVPRAVIGLRHLSNIWLTDKPIECSCLSMSYLESWNITSITINATCSSGKSVESYLTTDLPNCP